MGLMKLFDVLPERFFSVLSSKNRQLYIDALFLLQDMFSADQLIIRRDDYASRLREQLGNSLFSSDLEEDGEEENLSEIVADKASILIRNLKDAGWIEIEPIENKFDLQVFIPDYASDILETLRRIAEGKKEDLDTFIHSSYAYLKDATSPADRVDALDFAYANISSFEKELIKIFSNIKRYHKQSAEISDVEKLLETFLRNYQENIDRKYITPLTGKNSVERYRSDIKRILGSYRADEGYQRMFDAWLKKHGTEEQDQIDAENEIIHMVESIESRMDYDLPSLAARIRERDGIYKERTIARIKQKTASGKNIKKALVDIIHASEASDELQDAMSDSLSLALVSVYDRESLYHRREREEDDEEDEERIEVGTGGDESSFAELLGEIDDQISTDEIDLFVLDAMAGGEECQTSSFSINTIRDFALFILASLRAEEQDAPYAVEHEEGRVEVSGAMLPMMIFRRNRDA